MLKPANVAAPFTAFTEPPPDSVPPPGFALRASVIAPLKLVTLFSDASSALTFTGGVIVAPTCVLPGGMLNPRCVAGGGVPAATTRSTGTRAGLPTACAAVTTITSWFSTGWRVCKGHNFTGARTTSDSGVATPQHPGRRENQVIVPLR